MSTKAKLKNALNIMWKYFEIDSKPWLIKFTKKNELIQCFLCDFSNLWQEELNLNDLMLRSKELNSLIEHDQELVLKTVLDITKDCNFHENILSFKYYISKYPFNFFWRLKICSSDEYLNTVTASLMFSMVILQEQNKELQSIIKKKDLEIDQYKFEGATISRKLLITNKFEENDFTEKYKVSERENDFNEFLLDKRNKKGILKLCGVKNQLQFSNITPQKDSASSFMALQSPSQKRKIRHNKFQSKTIKMSYESNDDSESASEENYLLAEEKKISPTVPVRKSKFRKDLNF